VGIDHSEVGTIVETITQAPRERPRQPDWIDLTLFLGRP
jgi:hypothetical protein